MLLFVSKSADLEVVALIQILFSFLITVFTSYNTVCHDIKFGVSVDHELVLFDNRK